MTLRRVAAILFGAALLLANLGGTAARATPLSGFSEMFGTTTGTPLANDYVNTIVVQADGKILIGGAFNTVNNVTVNRLARLASTGVPDTAFNTALGTGLDDEPETIALLDNGKIIVGGQFQNFNSAAAKYIVRLTAAGARDTAFDAPFGTGFDGAVLKVLVQYDDEMIIAGSFANLNAVATKPMIRLNADLTWDTGFVTNQGGSFNGSINSMAFQSGGAVVAVGPFTQLNSVTANRIARLQNNDPTPDLSGSGADTGILVVVGLGLLAAGGAVLMLRRRPAQAR